MNLIQSNTLIANKLHIILKNIFLLCIIFCLFSCKDEPKVTNFAEKPKNLLNYKKMKVVLTEIHLAEAQVQFLKINNPDTARAVFNEFQKKIFLKNKIDSLDFDRSYEYYTRSLQMDSIYKQVSDTMKIITQKKTFGHEILPKKREIDETEQSDSLHQKDERKNGIFKKNKKIRKVPITEQT